MKQLVTAVVLALVANTALAGNCKFERDFERSFDVTNLNDLAIAAGAGSLEIIGEAGISAVLVTAEGCAPDEELLEKLDVVFDVDEGLIKTMIPRSERRGSATLDVVILVPSSLNLDVKDSSGEASVKGVASLNMIDSSGELEISEIIGDVSVVDSSGALQIEEVGGDVELTDSSGRIEASDIQGNVTIIADSSGSIELERIGKNVLIKADTSGSIEVDDVGGDFTVGRDSSGGIRHDDVAGKVSLPRGK